MVEKQPRRSCWSCRGGKRDEENFNERNLGDRDMKERLKEESIQRNTKILREDLY